MSSVAKLACGLAFLAMLWLMTGCGTTKVVTINTDPKGAKIYLNGADVGISPLTRPLKFGSRNDMYEVIAKKDGYKDGDTRIMLEPKNEKAYSITLDPVEAVSIELVSVEPERTEKGVKLALVRKPTLAYLEVIERSPNVASVTKVTNNEDKGIQIGPPVLSPTEDVVLYWEFVEEQKGSWYSNIQKQRVGASAKTRLTYGKWRDLFPAFTPDGEHVVFSSNRTSSNPTLWRVKVEGAGGLSKLTNTASEDFSPSVSPDGRFIAFASNPPDTEEPQIWTTPLDASLLTQLREGETPQVSPDGKQLLFVRQDKLTKKRQLWLMSVDGAEETQLTQNSDYDVVDPRWSPNGKWIVFAADEGRDSQQNQNFDVWLMAMDGTQRTQLTTNGSRDDGPCWDHNGEFIYFRSNRGGAWNIWRFKPLLPTSLGPAGSKK